MSAPQKKFSLTVRPLPVKAAPQVSNLDNIIQDKAPDRVVTESERILIAGISDKIDGSKYNTVSELYSYLHSLNLIATDSVSSIPQ